MSTSEARYALYFCLVLWHFLRSRLHPTQTAEDSAGFRPTRALSSEVRYWSLLCLKCHRQTQRRSPSLLNNQSSNDTSTTRGNLLIVMWFEGQARGAHWAAAADFKKGLLGRKEMAPPSDERGRVLC